MIEEVAKTSRAWLLNFGGGLQAAVGHHEMWQVLISPTLFDVPGTPRYCNDVLIFQEQILPVLNVPNMLLEGQKIIIVTSRVVGIAVFQEDPNLPVHYGGMYLASMPLNIYVSDEQVCDLPDHQKYWEPLTLSCFSRNGVAIPIIDLAYLFSDEFNTIKQAGQKSVV